MLFRGVVAEQLFLGLLQGHPRHARFDLQPFQSFAAATGLLARPGPLDRRLHRVDRRGGGGFLALGLGGAHQRGLLRALGAFCGPALLVAAQASLALLETLTGLFGLQQLLPLLADLRLGRAVVLHQGNARRADVGAGAAFDAIEQVVGEQLLVLVAQGEEMQLLWQQADGADLGAVAAADTGHGRHWFRQLRGIAGEQAVAGLDQRHREIGQGEAHHRPAHQHAFQASLGEAGERQQLVYRRTDQRLDVHRPLQGAAGEGGDPRDQRPTEDDGIVHGGQGADVLAQDADVRRQAVRRDFPAGEQLDQLALAARGIAGRQGDDAIGPFTEGGAEGGDGFRFVVLDANQHLFGAQDLHQDIDAAQHLRGALAHEQVVGADVGLAFGAVHHQRMDLVRRARGELGGGGEAGAAETADAGRADTFEQRQRAFGAEVRAGMQLGPALQAVAGDDDGRRGKTGGMRIGVCADRHHGPRGRGMQRGADGAVREGDGLAFEHGLADFHARPRRRAHVLAERHDVALRQRRLLDRQGGGALLVGRQAEATGEGVQGAHAARSRSLAISRGDGCGHFQWRTSSGVSRISMQSTGQGSRHRSQPVHSSAITVCISRAAPTMASTGQAWMHLVQPMHSASRM